MITRSLVGMAAVACYVFSVSIAHAAGPMKIVVPFAAGGGGDTLARALAPYLSRDLQRPVIVENKPGANGQLAMQLVKRAPADGSIVILATDSAISVVPLTVKSPGYDVFKDFVPLGQVARYPYALITPVSAGVVDVSDLLNRFKKDPSSANIGLPGAGGLPEKLSDELGRRSGVQVGAIVYAGASPMIPFILGGQLSAGVVALNNGLPLARAGKINVLAVTGEKRSILAADAPTFKEIGFKGFEAISSQSFLAPAGISKDFSVRFNKSLNAALADKDLANKINSLSMEVAPTDLAGAQAEIRKSHQMWTALLR